MMKYPGDPNKRGARKFGLAVQQPAQIQEATITITGSKYFSESCHKYSLLGLLNKSTNVLQARPRKIENVISGALVKAGGWKN